MPTVMSHAIAALALGPAFRRAGWPARVWWAAAICAAVPDADVLGVFAGVPLGSLLGHRGLTHSPGFRSAGRHRHAAARGPRHAAPAVGIPVPRDSVARHSRRD